MIRLLTFFFILPYFVLSQALTVSNPYQLNLTASVEDYQNELNLHPDNELVNLIEVLPELVLDIRYATHNNFTHDIVYELPMAFLRRPVAEALAEVQKELKVHGLGLKIFDAYRPYKATLAFWNLVGDTKFVASPMKGSRHNRGAAVDLTLIVLATGSELIMPTAYDDFTEKASPACSSVSEPARANRDFLIRIMKRHGFSVFPTEWWHFDYKHWERFGLMDLSFTQLIEFQDIKK